MEGDMESDYEKWWRVEGSGLPPFPGEDAEAHVRRLTRIAWSNGAYKERERIAKAILKERAK
jgi:hypothetical protein